MARSTTRRTPAAATPSDLRPSSPRPGGAGRRRRALRAVALLGVLGVALAACSSAEPPAPEAPDPVTVSPTIDASRGTPPDPSVPTVWPLTGVETTEVAARPAVAIKVENTSVARPQSGLEAADVVWETIVEFEVSRFVAVYHSQVPDEVGPIRSVRPVDPLIVAPLDGVLAYSGGQSRLLNDLAASDLTTLNNDFGDPGMYRVRFRSAPHNVYGSVETLMRQGEQAAPPEQFAFALRPEQATAAVEGTPATALSFRLSAQSRPSWSWDAGSGTWLRSEGGSPATVASGARISAVNVVAITAPHPNSRFKAQGGTFVPTYTLVGEGQAVVATGGKTLTGTWRKAGMADPLLLFTADGEPLELAPGNTWVELVPEGKGSVSVS